MEIKIYTMNIFSAGGNSSKAALAHKISIPTRWAKIMGFTKTDRTAKLTFTDDHRIIIEKCPADYIDANNDNVAAMLDDKE